MKVKNSISFIILLSIVIFLILAVYFKFFYTQKDVFEDITSWEELVEVYQKDKEVVAAIENNNFSSNYTDKIYALDYLSMCWKINDVESVKSEEFLKIANLEKLNSYFYDNNVASVEECLYEYELKYNNVKDECIFNEDDGIHNPFLVAYAQDKITTIDFEESLTNIWNFYMDYYPSNSYILFAIRDKNNGTFTDISYCESMVENHYDDFIKTDEDELHENTGPGSEWYTEIDIVTDDKGVIRKYTNGELIETIEWDNLDNSNINSDNEVNITTTTTSVDEDWIERKYVNGELIETINHSNNQD